MIRRLAAGSLLVLLLTSVVAFTAVNTVADSTVGFGTSGVTANDLKPPQCASLNLVRVRVGFGGGTGVGELVLGTAGWNLIVGGGGNDCLVGGAGSDLLLGGGGTDVCIGGPGTDFFVGCETQFQ